LIHPQSLKSVEENNYFLLVKRSEANGYTEICLNPLKKELFASWRRF